MVRKLVPPSSHRATAILFSLALILSAAPARTAGIDPYPPLTEDLKVEQVPGSQIYYVIGHPAVPSEKNEGHTSNAGFVVTPEGVVVFDSLGTPALGLSLINHIRKITTAPIRYVVISHYHADHIYGLQAFKEKTSAIIVAQEKSADYLNPNNTDDEAALPRLAQRREALAPWVNAATKIIDPDVTFGNDITLSLGGKKFAVIYAGPAHSQSDSMMLVQPDGVLFAGDIVQNGRIPSMSSADVDTAHWRASIDALAKLNPRFIIPGHGQPSTDVASAIAFTRDYLDFVRGQMAVAVQKWTDFETAYKAVDWSPYKNVPAFDFTNKGNAYRVYLEMEHSSFDSAH